MMSAMALMVVNVVNYHPTKTSKSVLFQVCRAYFGAVCPGELHLKEPVVANENDMVVCSRIEFVRGVRWNIGISRRVESANCEQCTSHTVSKTHSHLYESIESGAPRTFSGSSWALKQCHSCNRKAKKKQVQRTFRPASGTEAWL